MYKNHNYRVYNLEVGTLIPYGGDMNFVKKSFLVASLNYFLFGLIWGYVASDSLGNEWYGPVAFALCYFIAFLFQVVVHTFYQVPNSSKNYFSAFFLGFFLLGSLLFSYSNFVLFYGVFALVVSAIFKLFEN